MENEIPFFTKSKDKFETSTISAWWMLTKHLAALKKMTRDDMPNKRYKSLWEYKNYLIRTIHTMEKIPCFQILLESGNPLHLRTFYKEEEQKEPCRTKELRIITVGDFGSTLPSSSSFSGEQ